MVVFEKVIQMGPVLQCSARAERMHKAAVQIIRENIDNPSKGCEVGVLRGELSVELLNTFANLNLYMVDCYLPDKYRSSTDAKEIMRIAFQNTLSFENRRIMLVGKSVQAAHLIQDGFLDFVYIDAAHDERSVTKDITVWYPKVRSGGLISGHDYSRHRAHKGVVKAVDKFTGKTDYKINVHKTNWWFIKK